MPSFLLSLRSRYPPSEIEQYNTDWMGRYRGRSTTVLRPQTTEQVSKIMKWCHERRIGVVPQGGNTGLVGGSVPLKDELILSLSNMAKVRSFDPVSGASWTSCSVVLAHLRTFNSHPGALVADAGCILEALSEYIAPHDHIMPLDLGAKGRYNQSQFLYVAANFNVILAVRSVETFRLMRVDFVFYDTAPCTEACLVSKLCYQTELSWIACPR
jgi:hypothetical protein